MTTPSKSVRRLVDQKKGGSSLGHPHTSRPPPGGRRLEERLLNEATNPPVPIRTDPFAVGEVIADKYYVEGILGEGGMAIVVAARHIELDEYVAVKFLRPELQTSQSLVQRFAAEARAAVRIKSEYSAQIFDVGTMPGRGPFIIMEYLDGRDLADVVSDEGPLPIQRAVEYMLQTCEALALAHSYGIIHRDIKPENLFLTKRPNGVEAIKVLDFGISKAALAGPEAFDLSSGLMGSPSYMSPEQIASPEVDARADIWSLGVVLYTLLTGRVPFDASTVAEQCALVSKEEPTNVSVLRPGTPAELSSVLHRCLEKDPNRRFPNVAELALALMPFGGKRARGYVERSASTLRSMGAPVNVTVPPSMPPPKNPNRPVGPPPSVTPTDLTTEAVQQFQPQGRRPWGFVLGGAVALLAVGFFVLRVRSIPPETTPMPVAPEPAAAAPQAAAPALPAQALPAPESTATVDAPSASPEPSSKGKAARIAVGRHPIPGALKGPPLAPSAAAGSASDRPRVDPPKPTAMPTVSDSRVKIVDENSSRVRTLE